MKNKYLECGKIVNTHGVRGCVKIESMCDTPEIFSALEKIYIKSGEAYAEHRMLSCAPHKGDFVLATLEGVDSVEAAIPLKNETVYADRDDLPLGEGAYFLSDVAGLDALDAGSGEKYGTVRGVINRGAQDIFVIDAENGEFMVPAVPEFIKKVDTDKAVYIKIIEGMLP